jgi:hypothetical protein
LAVTVLPVPTAAVSKLPVPLQSRRRADDAGQRAADRRGRVAVVGLVRRVIAGVSVAAVMLAVVVALVADSA